MRSTLDQFNRVIFLSIQMSSDPVKLAARWCEAVEECVEDIGRFLSDFEALFELCESTGTMEMKVFADPKDGVVSSEFVDFSKRPRQLIRALELCRTQQPSVFVISHEPLERMRHALILRTNPGVANGRKTTISADLGSSFHALRNELNRFQEAVELRTVLNDTELASPEPSEPETDRAEQELRGQLLELYRFLVGRIHWTDFETLKQQSRLWKGEPDSADITDAKVSDALQRLQAALRNKNIFETTLVVSKANRRTKLSREPQ